ncbi:MAG: hypothetical protein JKX70_02035 [Phycisphaerales bacterium]|nr:hypothetical protein [Phycisphaerales bacterium]
MSTTYTETNTQEFNPYEIEEPESIRLVEEIDEQEREESARSLESLTESPAADQAESIPMMSVVDRDLGLAEHQSPSKQSKQGRYSCPCCQQGATRVMRVRIAHHRIGKPRWMAMCAVCAASMLARIPGTIVGGMVRPSRRRRPIGTQAAGATRQESQHGFRPKRDIRYRRAG